MRCISCETEINPQWKHAIEANICPMCGQAVVDEHLKNLLFTLRNTMEGLQQYSEQLNDWLLSNYQYIRTDSSKLIDYVSKEALKDLKKIETEKDFQEKKTSTIKVKTDTGEEEVMVEKVQSEEQINEFFKRAQVITKSSKLSPAERTQYLKNMAQQIKKSGNVDMSSSETLAEADPEAVAELRAVMEGSKEIASALSMPADDDVPDHILAANMAAAKARGGVSSNAANDLLKLQQLQARINQSKANFESGGKGSFSRG